MMIGTRLGISLLVGDNWEGLVQLHRVAALHIGLPHATHLWPPEVASDEFSHFPCPGWPATG